MRIALVLGLFSACLGCDALSGGGAKGELTRSECVQMTVRIDDLRNKELGRVNSVEQRNAVDRCVQHGTKAQLECVNFANNAGELARCDELAK